MRKWLTIFMVVFFLSACNQTAHPTETDERANHEHAVAGKELALNNGTKWKADAITNQNVASLKIIADNFKLKTSPSIDDYQLAGADLNGGINKLIKDCKMSGPDHDELHKWLEPVLKEINQLKTISDTTLARTIFQSINVRIENYYNFFE